MCVHGCLRTFHFSTVGPNGRAYARLDKMQSVQTMLCSVVAAMKYAETAVRTGVPSCQWCRLGSDQVHTRFEVGKSELVGSEIGKVYMRVTVLPRKSAREEGEGGAMGPEETRYDCLRERLHFLSVMSTILLTGWTMR